MAKKGSEVVEGENLDVLIGNRPLKVEPADDASDEEKPPQRSR